MQHEDYPLISSKMCTGFRWVKNALGGVGMFWYNDSGLLRRAVHWHIYLFVCIIGRFVLGCPRAFANTWIITQTNTNNM